MDKATTMQLADAADRMGRLVAAVPADQWSSPTPCADWNVRDLVAHVVTGTARFTAAITGAPQAPPPDSADLPGAFARNSAALVSAFGTPGALEKIVDVPFGRVPGAVALHLQLTEMLVHGWDLARATGRRPDFPDDLAAQELAFTVQALSSVPPERSPFAPPQPIPDTAPALDRLAAMLGRSVP
ncbi:TIGR03086 family metal-binding protein [Actinoplanes sp. NPDC049548]|uniref:TIGR03086 family metal-binding protein n=1 Tax=Actinoplanes sp. NPDC049548 TaxID=3155152 RepID=UPI003444C71F